jgi:hypothetical protein
MTITFLIARIIFGGYWLLLAPVFFLPLGIVLISSQVRRGTFGYVVALFAVIFAGLGVALLLTVTLCDALTLLAVVQAVWWLPAAISFLARNKNEPAAGLVKVAVLGTK